MSTVVKKKPVKKSASAVRRTVRKRVIHKKEEPLTYEKVLQLFKETDKRLEEKFRETDRILKEQSRETDRMLKEQSKETGRRLNELHGLFTSQWGKLVEALLGVGCLKVFQEKGIKVYQSFGNPISKMDGKTMEIDVLLANGTEAVLIEVKTTAKVSHVKELLEDLKEFKTFFPRYADCKVYGAIAALKFNEQSDRYAASQGLFVVEPAGEGLVNIKNTNDFKPKAF